MSTQRKQRKSTATVQDLPLLSIPNIRFARPKWSRTQLANSSQNIDIWYDQPKGLQWILQASAMIAHKGRTVGEQEAKMAVPNSRQCVDRNKEWFENCPSYVHMLFVCSTLLFHYRFKEWIPQNMNISATWYRNTWSQTAWAQSPSGRSKQGCSARRCAKCSNPRNLLVGSIL